jgi:hypothetical protein
MDNTLSIENQGTVAAPALKGAAVGLAALLLIVGFTLLGLRQLRPPAAVPESAALTEFSSARAMQHLKAIAQRPHPIGSAEHAAVRDTVVKGLTEVGLAPEVQKTSVVSQRHGAPFSAGTVENVVARLRGGGQGGKAVLLASHYDSVPTGAGASDDGSGVAALLETARALKAGAPLKNDVIFLFTDGEEFGLLGAKAFVDQHPWAKEVGVALNFEARGNAGPSMMFETSPRNGALISALGKAAPAPVANSLAYEIYKRMPNDTDLTVFKEAGLPGMNFAYFEGLPHYHTALDSAGEADVRSLQHQGSYALALARYFGNLDLGGLTNGGGGDAVYFDLPGAGLVRYPAGLVMPLALLVTVLFVGVVILGFRWRELSFKGSALGFVSFALGVAASPVVVMVIWRFRRIVHDTLRLPPQADIYNAHLYLISFIAITAAVVFAVYAVFSRWVRLQELLVGSMSGWLLLMLVSAVLWPGASYLLTWPLLFSELALGLQFFKGDVRGRTWGRLATVSLGALPGLLLFVPMIYLIFNALTLNSYLFISLMVALLLGLLVSLVRLITPKGRWLIPGGAALAGVAVMVIGGYMTGFDAERPKTTHVLYGVNPEMNKAVWASGDQRPDAWTAQFLTKDARPGSLGDFIPARFNGFYNVPAPVVTLPAPTLTMLDDSKKENGVRVLRLHVDSPRRAPTLVLSLDSAADVLHTFVNGREDGANPPPSRGGPRNWGLEYYAAPEEGIDLTLELLADEPIKLKVMDVTYGLPEIPGRTFTPRPGDAIPAPIPYSDSTVVTHSYTF